MYGCCPFNGKVILKTLNGVGSPVDLNESARPIDIT